MLADTEVCGNWLKYNPLFLIFYQADLGHLELRYRKGTP